MKRSLRPKPEEKCRSFWYVKRVLPKWSRPEDFKFHHQKASVMPQILQKATNVQSKMLKSLSAITLESQESKTMILEVRDLVYSR